MDRGEWRRNKRTIEKIKKRQEHVPTSYEKGYMAGFEAGKNQSRFEMAGYCVRTMTTAIAAVIRSEEKWGNKKIRRLLTLLHAQLEDILSGVVSEEKLRKWILKEVKIDLNEFTGSNRLDIMQQWEKELGVTTDVIMGEGVDFSDLPRKVTTGTP